MTTTEENIRVLKVKENVLGDNDIKAEKLRERLKSEKTFLLNLMASPGAGKTSLLVKTINELKNEFKIGVMEADIDSTVDTRTILQTGVSAIQLHTGGMCHLDADMTEQGLKEIGTEDLDLVVLENIGNLVCPAEFDTGATKNVMILSVPEGDDKPLKYPLMFSVVDAVVVNKIDVLAYFDFDMATFKENLARVNDHAKVFEVSAKTGEGIMDWTSWLSNEIKEQQG